MQVTPIQGVPIDSCEFCYGQFFDSFEVERALDLPDIDPESLQRLGSPVPTDSADGQPLSCPGCRQMMRTWELPGPPLVRIDRCRGCKGIWLDGGEGRKLTQALAAAGFPDEDGPVGTARTGPASGPAPRPAPRQPAPASLAARLFFGLFDFLVPGD